MVELADVLQLLLLDQMLLLLLRICEPLRVYMHPCFLTNTFWGPVQLFCRKHTLNVVTAGGCQSPEHNCAPSVCSRCST